MSRYLVVANQTLGGEQLDRTIRDRIGRGDSEFFVVVPMTAPEHESNWTGGFVAYEGMTGDEARAWIEQDTQRRRAQVDAARNLAEQRLGLMTEKIHAVGAQVEGTVGDADPALAVKEVLRDQAFDEIIVSMLPTRISRWLRMDLPSRVRRMTEAPVTIVEAEDEKKRP